jgi:hypothetical protein
MSLGAAFVSVFQFSTTPYCLVRYNPERMMGMMGIHDCLFLTNHSWSSTPLPPHPHAPISLCVLLLLLSGPAGRVIRRRRGHGE